MSVILEEIKLLVSMQLGIHDINDSDRFQEELGAESVDVMNIIAAVEEKYQVAIKESEIPHILTPIALVEFVTQAKFK